jgi:hypothetical protein
MRAHVSLIAVLFLATGTMIIGTRSARVQAVCAGKYEQKVDFDRCMRDWVDPKPVKKSDDGPAHVDGFEAAGKALDEFFKWLRWSGTNWLGTVFVDYKPWNGVWPNTTVLQHEPGGIIVEHINRWRQLAQSGDDVEIRGPCFSACTLIVAYVPKERLCFGDYASLQFHLAWVRETGTPSLDWSLWMLAQYPQDIRNWLMARGGVANMTIQNFWELRAKELWDMGYHKCKSSTVLWTGPGDTIIIPSGNNGSGNDALRN